MYTKLREVRLKAGMTHVQMGKLIGLCESSYAKKELGTRAISLDEAFILSDFFKMTIEELFVK